MRAKRGRPGRAASHQALEGRLVENLEPELLAPGRLGIGVFTYHHRRGLAGNAALDVSAQGFDGSPRLGALEGLEGSRHDECLARQFSRG